MNCMVCVFCVDGIHEAEKRSKSKTLFSGQDLEQLKEDMKKELDIMRDQLKIISSFHIPYLINILKKFKFQIL